MNKITMKLDLPNVLISDSVAQSSMKGLLEKVGTSPEEIADVNIALSEAITNCILHAYPEATGSIIVTYELSGKELTVIVHDSGIGIANVEEARRPIHSTAGRSGMGFTIMESFMGDVKVTSIPARGTTVTMKRKFDDE